MSYILDALRKADAQRARDPVRGIHAQPLRTSGTSVSDGGLQTWHIALALGVAAALAAGGWLVFRADATPDRVEGRDGNKAVVTAAAAPPMAAAVTQPVITSVPPQPGTRAEAPASPSAAPPQLREALQAQGKGVQRGQPSGTPVVGSAIQPPPAAPIAAAPATAGQLAAAMPPGWPVPGDPRAPRGDIARRPAGSGMDGIAPQPVQGLGSLSAAAQVAPAPIAQPATGAPPPVTSPSEFTVPLAPQMSPATPNLAPNPTARPLIPATGAPMAIAPTAPSPPAAGLPSDAPKLVINGGVYSTSKAQRMLIVNGQVYNEGNEIATGVVLDEVRSKTAVLRYRGARYTVSF